MKFTKENAYEELVKLLTANGEKLNLSQRSINEQLETLMPLLANDETELNDFVKSVLPVFKTADANVRNDVSVGINKYKEENPIKPIEKPQQTIEQPTGEPTEMEKRLAAMEEKLAAAEKKERNANIKSEIVRKLKEKGVKNDDWVNALLSEVSITDDFDVDAKVESYVNLFNKINADYNPDVTPHGTGGGKHDYIGDTIKQAAAFAKSQNLIEK